jgi:UDP-glucose 4-epimerase
MRHILITGASGFVGRHLVPRLLADGHALTLAVRAGAAPGASSGPPRTAVVGGISGRTDWRPALEGCDTVVHLAARTPARGVVERSYFEVNDEGTARLCAQAAEAGVGHIVMMSSIFALVDNASERIVDDRTASGTVAPYGRSKLAAEGHVRAAAGPARATVSLRPPLVYGPGAKGNWRRLETIAASGVPLPFATVQNRRSLVSVVNLVDAVAKVVSKPGQPGSAEAFAVADADPLSTADIVRALREGMGLSPRLFPVPSAALSAVCGLIAGRQTARSLLGSLEICSRRFCEAYGWSPPEAAHEAVRRTGAEFVSRKSAKT